MWTRVESLIGQWFQLIAVTQLGSHESNTIAVDCALTTNADVLGMLGPKPQHTLASVLAKSAKVINALIRVGFKSSGSFKIKLNITLKLDRSGKESVVTWQQYSAASLC